jgi:hypothetical protein
MARVTGLEPAAFRVTGGRSNQLSYTRAGCRAGPYATNPRLVNGKAPIFNPFAN